MEFTVLLDAPAQPAKLIQIAKLGSFSDARYGEFDITAENVENWRKNLSKLPGGEALIDFEHRSERKPRDSKAAGWISGIHLDGEKVMADARWTPGGQDAIETETYRFLSPVFGPALGADNSVLDDALPSVALTNKPVLGMPAVCLASEERVSAAIDEDPALRFHTRALDGDYGDHTQALVLLDVSQAERDKAHEAGNSLPDKSYPINNVKQLKAAAVLAASKHGDYKAAQKLIRRRAKELGVDVTTLAGFGSEKTDSPRAMETETLTLDTETLKLLDLPEDADAEAINAAVKQLAVDPDGDGDDDSKQLDALVKAGMTRPQAIAHIKRFGDSDKKLDTEPPEPKQLEQLAKDQGLVILDAEEAATLRQGAAAGVLAQKELHQSKFDTAFEGALNDPKGARVVPEERERLQKFFDMDADETLAMISERESIVPAKPKGQPVIDLEQLDETDPSDIAAAGLHPEAHKLDQRIRKHMLDQKLPEGDYHKILEQVMTGAVRL